MQDYLLLDEIDSDEICEEEVNSKSCKIELNNVTVKWPAHQSNESQQNTLENVSFTANSGQLIIVVGQVGSGKVEILIACFIFIFALKKG